MGGFKERFVENKNSSERKAIKKQPPLLKGWLLIKSVTPTGFKPVTF